MAASYRPEDDLQVMLPSLQYTLENTYEVNGRQGICSEDDYYWVSKYDLESGTYLGKVHMQMAY